MNLKRFLGLTLFTYLMLALWAVGNVDDTKAPETAPTPPTIHLNSLTPQQMQDRAVELTTTAAPTIPAPTTTTTTLAPIDPDTKCQEWLPVAVSVGWPNNTETLQKLGRLLWKETRCLNITPLSSDPVLVDLFNGSDHGISQVNETAHTDYVEQVFNMPFAQAMSDPTLNLRYAYLLYSELEAKGRCGWQPWRLC